MDVVRACVRLGIAYGIWSTFLTFITLICIIVRYRKQRVIDEQNKKERAIIDLEGVQIGGTALREGERVFVTRGGGEAKELVFYGRQARLEESGKGKGEMIIVNGDGEAKCGTELADGDTVVITRREGEKTSRRSHEQGIRPGKAVKLVYGAGYGIHATKLIFKNFPTGKHPEDIDFEFPTAPREADAIIERSKGPEKVDVIVKTIDAQQQVVVKGDVGSRVDVIVCPVGAEVIAAESVQLQAVEDC